MDQISLKSILNRLNPRNGALSDFPWVQAILLYSLSWFWPLIHPNTLYWDDWAFIFGQPKTYLNQIFVDTGLPPWRALIDQQLISIGYWTLPILTFVMFFVAGLFLFQILKDTKVFSPQQINFATVVFLIIPINHARVALVLFGYTTSYFLFFAGWLLLIRSKKTIGVLFSLMLFFWCFMTHSFLFFYVIPVIHFAFKNFSNFSLAKDNIKFTFKFLLVLFLPVVYYFLRSIFWYPKPEWEGYQRFTFTGAKSGMWLMIIGLLPCLLIILLTKKLSQYSKSSWLLLTGWVVFTWGLFPYFASYRITTVMEIVAFRSDYGGRNIMLTPLGAALMLVSISEIFFRKYNKAFTNSVIAIFVIFNTFFGTQIYLDSLKKDQLVELFAESQTKASIDIDSEIVFVDETKIFNTRGSTYRDPELIDKLSLANLVTKSISGKISCGDLPTGLEVKLKSKRPYINALFSRDLGLYFEINKC